MYRFLILIICLLMFSHISYAENWVEVYKDSPKAFVDVDSIIVKPNGSILYNLKYYNSMFDSYLVATVLNFDGKMGVVKQVSFEDYIKSPKIDLNQLQNSAIDLRPIESQWFVVINDFVIKYKNDNKLIPIKEDIFSNYKLKENDNQNKTLESKKMKNVNKVELIEYAKRMNAKAKKYWKPIKINKSSSIVIVATINKNGELINSQIVQSSGSVEQDNTALEAIKKGVPFDSYEHIIDVESIDIQFTFDYMVMDTFRFPHKNHNVPESKNFLNKRKSIKNEDFSSF